MPPKDAAVEVPVVVDDTPKPPTVDALMAAAKLAAAKHHTAFEARRDAENALAALVSRQEDLRVASAKAFAALNDALETMKSGGL